MTWAPGSSPRPSSWCRDRPRWPPSSTWPARSSAGPSGRRWRATVDGSLVLPYLNRLSSLLWVQARWVEGEHLLTRDVPPEGG